MDSTDESETVFAEEALPPGESRDDMEAVGSKIRTFRKARKMTLRDLAIAADVSPGFLSQLENGRTNAAIGTLRRVASALGMSFVDLFAVNTPTSRVLRRADRPLLPTRSGTKKYAVTLPPLQGVEVYISEVEPGESIGGGYTHGDSQEVAYVLRGTVVFTISESEFELTVGDSIEFRSSEPHGLVNRSQHVGEVMWITSPPTAVTQTPKEKS